MWLKSGGRRVFVVLGMYVLLQMSGQREKQ